MKEVIFTQKAPKPVGPYSQAVRVGKFLYVSGQLPIDPGVGRIVSEEISLQTRQVLQNVKAILEAAGFSLKDVIQSTVYLSSMTLFDAFNAEYAKFFDADFPARATVAAALKGDALVEVSVVAFRD